MHGNWQQSSQIWLQSFEQAKNCDNWQWFLKQQICEKFAKIAYIENIVKMIFFHTLSQLIALHVKFPSLAMLVQTRCGEISVDLQHDSLPKVKTPILKSWNPTRPGNLQKSCCNWLNIAGKVSKTYTFKVLCGTMVSPSLCNLLQTLQWTWGTGCIAFYIWDVSIKLQYWKKFEKCEYIRKYGSNSWS